MKKIIIIFMLALLAFSPLAANGLYGFGFTYGFNTVGVGSDLYESTTTLSGLGFNVDTYFGQKLGIYAGGAFGWLLGGNYDITPDIFSSSGPIDMGNYDMKLFGEALVGLGAFLPVANRFDLSLGVGPGITWTALRADIDGAEIQHKFSLGLGGSVALGMPVGTNTEAYIACRSIFGFIDLSDVSDYQYTLTITPALGVKIKL